MATTLPPPAISGAAWARFGAVFGLGSLLALVAGGIAYNFFRVNAALPLATLQGRIRQRGLEPKLSRTGVGELFGGRSVPGSCSR